MQRYRSQSFLQIAILICLLIFVGWSLLTMRQSEEQAFREEALNRCRVLEVAIADRLTAGATPRRALIQERIDTLVRNDPQIVRLSVIAMAGDGRYRHIASSLPSRVGKPANPEDLEAFSSGDIVFLEEDYRDVGALDVTYPVQDFDGHIIALIGYTVSRPSKQHAHLVLNGLGLLTLLLLLFHLWQMRLLARQEIAVQDSLRRQLQAEESLNALSKELHQAKKMEAIGLLAGGVAHDLNNMLMGVVALPDLMLEEENLNPQQRQRLSDIRDAGMRASEVVNDMQTLSRNSAVDREVVDLNRTIEDYLDSPEFREHCNAHHVEIIPVLAYGIPAVLGTGSHLRKVVMNLVINAMEACGEQGRVTIETSLQKLASPLQGYETIPPGDYVRIRISDNGGGIDTDAREKIFDPFFSTKGLGRSGTGLGLAVCWSVIHDHSGHFDVNSSPSGSMFDVYLPASALKVPAATDEDTNPLPGKGASVMVIDDEDGPRRVICDMLRNLGYHAQEAASGEAALEALAGTRVDLLLLDMIMVGGMNGLETYKRVLDLHPGQKALIVSGQAESMDVLEAQRLGAGRFLKKPLNLQQLATEIYNELHQGQNGAVPPPA